MTAGPETSDFAGRLAAVRARIDAAALAAGRDPSSVRLVGASKGVSADRLVEAADAGLVDLGENRAQEMLGKVDEPGLAPVRWHFIGRLQRNKVGALAPHVTVWHSVDRLEVGAAVARHAPGARVFVQVALAPEPSKGGCAPDDVGGLAARLGDLGLDVLGLMAVPPDDGAPRPWFARLAVLAHELGLAELSMGMSGDVEDAVAEGATVVRVGTALFGPRPVPEPWDDKVIAPKEDAAMASVWKRTMVYLGLVDDDEYEGYGYENAAPAPRPSGSSGTVSHAPEQSSPSVRPIPREESNAVTTLPDAGGGQSPTATAVRSFTPTTTPRVHVIEPQGFNDAQEVGDRLKAGQPVILNLQGLDRGLQRRLVDFSSGLTYALNGSMHRAAEQVFLLTPSNVEVSQEEKERLRGRGLYEDN